jgi:hypothetical protein
MEPIASLRLALRLNAGFSTISALCLFVAHTWLADAMGVDARLLIAVGVGLAGFAAMLLFTAARSDVRKLRVEALSHSLADFAWVVASLGVIAAGLLTHFGNGMLLAVAVPVLALGIAQYRSLPTVEQGAQSSAINS